MATTLGDFVPPGEPPSMGLTLSEALAQAERLGRELAEERARGRRLEEELRDARRLEAVGRMAGGVAHDFSNILAVITGHSELMLRRLGPTDPLRTGVESIRKAAAWGLNLTQHMVSTSRTALPQPTTLDLNAVVTGVVQTLQPLLGARVEVALQLDPRLGTITAGAEPLEQALMNLLLNARDAMPGGGRITVETGNVTLEQSPVGRVPAAMVRVSDTGHGMDAATLSRAFEPYFTTKPAGRGSGLGLATVFAFVTQNGGHIEATSEVGRGAVFSLYLPRAVAADETAVAASPDSITVLVVEAETGVRELIGEILQLHGYQVVCARDMDEARRLSQQHPGPIKLVIADLLSPGVADRVLERLGPERAEARVLYLSGDLEGTVDEYRALPPGRTFLHKPFTVDALVHKVTEILR